MRVRKEMKKSAKTVLKEHFLLFIAVCFLGVYIGAEFSSSLDFLQIGKNVVISDQSDKLKRVDLETVLETYEKGTTSKDQEKTQHLLASKKEKPGNEIFGRSAGVFAGIANSITSGAVYMKAITAVQSVVHSSSITVSIFVVLSGLATILVWFFIQNTFAVVARRIYLEGRTYEYVPAQRFLFLLAARRWMNASFVMFVRKFYLFFWSFTIVGGIIKYYAYYMVPYIVAENPGIKANDAITLSRRMMDGHKWDLFAMQLSFMGWNILGLCTAGLANIVFVIPYRISTYCELYADLREQTISNQVEGFQYFIDPYLHRKASDQELETVYKDVLSVIAKPIKEPKDWKGIRGWLARNAGVILFHNKAEQRYEHEVEKHNKIQELVHAAQGKEYPTRLFWDPEERKRITVDFIHYTRLYSVYSIILLFFMFSFIGWAWEVGFHLVTDGAFANRGVLYGPWLPIYGSGGMLILMCLYRIRKSPMKHFFLSLLLCGVVEYYTAYLLEITHDGMKWWDYTGYFLNLHSRVCAEGLLVFGVGGSVIVYAIAPLVDNLIQKIPRKILVPVCITLVIVFILDLCVATFIRPNTGKGITDYETSITIEQEEFQANENLYLPNCSKGSTIIINTSSVQVM